MRHNKAFASINMASKFKRQQRRKRWSDTGITFTADFAIRVQELGAARLACESSNDVSFHLKRLQESFLEFMKLHSTYAESSYLKCLVRCLEAVVQCCLDRRRPPPALALAPSHSQSHQIGTREPEHLREADITMTPPASSCPSADRDYAVLLPSGAANSKLSATNQATTVQCSGCESVPIQCN